MNPLHALALSLTPAQPLTPHPHWAPTADRPAPANPAAYTKGTSHHRGGCRAPASGSTDAQHMARDRAPPRLAVCEDGEWRDRRPRLLSPQRPRSFHYQASVSEHGASGRHPRALASFPPRIEVRGKLQRESSLPPSFPRKRESRNLRLGLVPHPSTATNSAMMRRSAAASAVGRSAHTRRRWYPAEERQPPTTPPCGEAATKSTAVFPGLQDGRAPHARCDRLFVPRAPHFLFGEGDRFENQPHTSRFRRDAGARPATVRRRCSRTFLSFHSMAGWSRRSAAAR